MGKFLMSFVYAFRGIKEGFKGRNMKIHGLCSIVVLSMGVYFKLSQTEWMIVAVLVSLVLSAELFNSSIEEICDRLRDDLGLSYVATKKARDIAAGAVLVIAIFAAFIGFTIFVPKFFVL